MTAREIPGKKNSKSPHRNLVSALKKEVSLMRELLANLHQEELCLLEGNFDKWCTIAQERSDWILQLQSQRSSRMDATVELAKWAVFEGKTELLPAEEASSCDILSQLDQVIALLERLNLQNCRNDALFEQVKEKKELPLYCSYPHPLHQKKRKISTATYTE